MIEHPAALRPKNSTSFSHRNSTEYNSELFCNNIECGAKLMSKCALTSCRHVFCGECAEYIERKKECPKCNERCEYLVHRVAKVESHSLFGLTPDIIMRVSQQAIRFWAEQIGINEVREEYKNVQEKSMLEDEAEKYRNKIGEWEEAYNALLANTEGGRSTVRGFRRNANDIENVGGGYIRMMHNNKNQDFLSTMSMDGENHTLPLAHNNSFQDHSYLHGFQTPTPERTFKNHHKKRYMPPAKGPKFKFPLQKMY